MKKILLFCAVVLVAALVAVVYVVRKPERFGAPFRTATAMGMDELTGSAAANLEKVVRVKGKIERQCPSSGCWFILKAGDGRELYVELSNLGSTMPQRTGRQVEVEGRLLKTDRGLELIGDGVEFH